MIADRNRRVQVEGDVAETRPAGRPTVLLHARPIAILNIPPQ